MNNYQPNQILQSSDTSYHLVVSVRRSYLQLKNLSSGAFIYPSTNSVFLDFCTLIGTADTHPELLI